MLSKGLVVIEHLSLSRRDERTLHCIQVQHNEGRVNQGQIARVSYKETVQ